MWPARNTVIALTVDAWPTSAHRSTYMYIPQQMHKRGSAVAKQLQATPQLRFRQ
jgi:hypothetical protein